MIISVVQQIDYAVGIAQNATCPCSAQFINVCHKNLHNLEQVDCDWSTSLALEIFKSGLCIFLSFQSNFGMYEGNPKGPI